MENSSNFQKNLQKLKPIDLKFRQVAYMIPGKGFRKTISGIRKILFVFCFTWNSVRWWLFP